MLYELIGFSRILYDFIWSCLKYGGIFSRLHQYPIGRIDRMLLSCSKFSLRSLSILTKIDNHCTLQDFVQDPVRPCKILYDSTVKCFKCLKFRADIIFDHGLNSKPHSLGNLSILENSAQAPQAYQCLISLFLASLGACNLILYIHVLID